MSIPVVPTPLTPNPPMICGFRYTVNGLEFNSYITFNVILLDQTNTPLSVRQVTMAGEDYANWGNSDQYVIDFICSTLGLTPLDPSVPVSPDNPVPVPVPVSPDNPVPVPVPDLIIPDDIVPDPVDPVPVPVPVDPVPVPEPVDPVPVPEPVDPVPVPEPVAPDDPVPVPEPEPVVPDDPVDPVPVDPVPVDPIPEPEPVVDPFTEPI